MEIENRLGIEVSAKLRAFSDNANKRVPHQLDRARWHRFVIAAHLERANLSVEDLGEWLEQEGWEKGAADDFAVSYEWGRDLLREYDEVV